MATLTINFTEGSTPDGYIVKYRVKGSSDPYTTVSPNPTTTPVIITGLLPNTEYEGTIKSSCVGEFNTETNFYSCTCPAGYTSSTDLLRCEKEETVAPSSSTTDYWVAHSRNSNYSSYFARVYNPGFSFSSLELSSPPASDVYAQLTVSDLWTSFYQGTYDASRGAMNRAGVWLDSDHDGAIDTASLAVGTQVTFSYTYDSPNPNHRVYVGVGGDNNFSLVVNGTTVAETDGSNNDLHFKIWHLIPVTLLQGTNFFNVIGTAGGSYASVAMTIYDNTATELSNAATLADLNVIYSSEQLINDQTMNVETCPDGYSLDTSEGTSVCKKITRTDCTGVSV